MPLLRALFAAIVCLSIQHVSKGFVAPNLNGYGVRTLNSKPNILKAINQCEVDNAPVQEAADFFGSVFFAGGEEIPPELTNLLHTNWLDRYGPLVGKRRFPSAVFVSRNEKDAIDGVVVVDISIIDVANKVILLKEEADQVVSGRLSKLGPKQRRVYKGASLPELLDGLMKEAPWKDAATGTEADFVLAPVLANLAVSPSARGQGIAKSLCDEVVAWSRSWLGDHEAHFRKDSDLEVSGNVLPQIWLLAEPSNTPAVTLYKGRGYTEKWVDENGSEVRLLDGGNIITETTTQIAMSKDVL